MAREITYLGEKLMEQGVQIDPRSIHVITKMLAPTERYNKRKVQKCLGMVNFVGKFVPKFEGTISNMSHSV